MRRAASVTLVVIPVVLAGCGPSAQPMYCVNGVTQQVAIDDYCAVPTPLHQGFMWYYGGLLYNGGYVRGGAFRADPGMRYLTSSRSFQAGGGAAAGRVTPTRGGFGATGSGHGGGEGE